MKTSLEVKASLMWLIDNGFLSSRDISISHIRERGKRYKDVKQYGGSTVVSLYIRNHGIFTGKAECSKKDMFNKRVGRDIALKRALLSVFKSIFFISKPEEFMKHLMLEFIHRGHKWAEVRK